MIRIGVDSKELRRRIFDSGFTGNYIAQMLEMRRSTLYRKVDGHNDFYPGEILRLCDLLKINKADREKIFRI